MSTQHGHSGHHPLEGESLLLSQENPNLPTFLFRRPLSRAVQQLSNNHYYLRSAKMITTLAKTQNHVSLGPTKEVIDSTEFWFKHTLNYSVNLCVTYMCVLFYNSNSSKKMYSNFWNTQSKESANRKRHCWFRWWCHRRQWLGDRLRQCSIWGCGNMETSIWRPNSW